MQTFWSRSRMAILLAAIGIAAGGQAHAEGTIRIVEQFGISYLPLYVIRDQGLLEKHGAAQGIDIEVEWTQVSGGSAANDALLSGSVDIVSAGVGPLLTIWDRTRGRADVRGIAATVNAPFYLLSNDPSVVSLEDFTDADRIALPSVQVSVQARTLQIAAAKVFGRNRYDALDRLTVSLPHPDATQALLSGSGTVTAYFSSAPYQYQLLDNPGIHKVLDSYEVLGGPATSVVFYTTAAFRNENPKTYGAFLAALDEADAWIAANREEAADTYIRVAESSLDRNLILSILNDPQVTFDPTPLRTRAYADFLHDIGAIEHRAASWRDYFFEDIHGRAGS